MAAVGDGTHAVDAPASSCAPFVATIAFMLSGSAHIPLPICPLPTRPCASAAATLCFSYAPSHGAAFIAAFGATAPARIDVWISSAVRSRRC